MKNPDDCVSPMTRRVEFAASTYTASLIRSAEGMRQPIRWASLVKKRIAFRHDETRGPASATVITAIY